MDDDFFNTNYCTKFYTWLTGQWQKREYELTKAKAGACGEAAVACHDVTEKYSKIELPTFSAEVPQTISKELEAYEAATDNELLKSVEQQPAPSVTSNNNEANECNYPNDEAGVDATNS